MTVTREDVLAIRDAVAKDPHLTPADVVQGVRTLVHARLMDERPMPHQLPPPDTGKSDEDFQAATAQLSKIRDDAAREAGYAKLHHEHVRQRAARAVRAKAGVSVEDQIRFEEARASNTLPTTVQDAHHFVQYEHGKNLWDETNALVASALTPLPPPAAAAAASDPAKKAVA